jgi:hypothetical protein
VATRAIRLSFKHTSQAVFVICANPGHTAHGWFIIRRLGPQSAKCQTHGGRGASRNSTPNGRKVCGERCFEVSSARGLQKRRPAWAWGCSYSTVRPSFPPRFAFSPAGRTSAISHLGVAKVCVPPSTVETPLKRALRGGGGGGPLKPKHCPPQTPGQQQAPGGLEN